VLTRTLRLEAGDGPAERKEWAMSTHAIRSNRVPATAIAVFLVLVLAVSVLAIQGHSVWSTTTQPIGRPATMHPIGRPTTEQVDPHPFKDDLRPSDLRPDPTKGGSSRPSLREIEARKGG
jgi:hypothetical protein